MAAFPEVAAYMGGAGAGTAQAARARAAASLSRTGSAQSMRGESRLLGSNEAGGGGGVCTPQPEPLSFASAQDPARSSRAPAYIPPYTRSAPHLPTVPELAGGGEGAGEEEQEQEGAAASFLDSSGGSGGLHSSFMGMDRAMAARERDMVGGAAGRMDSLDIALGDHRLGSLLSSEGRAAMGLEGGGGSGGGEAAAFSASVGVDIGVIGRGASLSVHVVSSARGRAVLGFGAAFSMNGMTGGNVNRSDG